MKTLFHTFINSWDIWSKTSHFESAMSTLCTFESYCVFLGTPNINVWIKWLLLLISMHVKISFISRLILEILDFHEFCNVIGQEHIQMCLITFNWNLWNNFLFLWISIKKQLQLIYQFEILWVCPTVPDQPQLIMSIDV